MTFLTGLIGFAVASAVGGASVNFTMLITARACQGAFAALLAPAALSLLTTTFSDPKERGKAFGVYGAIAGGGGLVGLLLGGLLTEYLDWRWCLYVNLVFAGAAVVGAILFLPARALAAHGPSRHLRRPDRLGIDVLPGVRLLQRRLAQLAHPVDLGIPGRGRGAAGRSSRWWQTRAAHPLLPPRVVLDRNRGGAYLAVLVAGAGMFGIFLFLTYYLQTILGYSPVVTGVAFLPTIVMVMLFAQISNVMLMPRIGPKLLVAVGMLLAAAGMVWLTRIGVHSSYASAIVGPMLVTGAGIGLSMPPSMNTGTFGVAPYDAGVASATLNVGQQLGGSIGTALLNTIATSATASYLASLHLPPAVLASPSGRLALAAAAVHGYTTAFWWTAGIFAVGAVVCEASCAGARCPSRPPPRPASPPASLSPAPPSPPEFQAFAPRT